MIYRSKEELYDYEQDPDALANLMNEPSHRANVERYRTLMLEQMRATEDPELEGYEKFLERVRRAPTSPPM